jgi:cation transport ATPase
MKEKFSVTGMTCTACSAGIERALRKLNGIKKADVSLMDGCLSVEYDETLVNQTGIFHTVTGLGYGIEEYRENTLKNNKLHENNLKKRFIFSLFLLLPLMYFSMGGMIGFPQPNEIIGVTVQAILALGVIILNYKFFTVGTKALFKGMPNMDTLVALGSGISFIYSFIYTLLLYVGKVSHAHYFYESAAMILSLVTLGKWLEERSKSKTGEEVEKLIKLMPNTVLVERNGEEIPVAFAQIQSGEVLIVKQGEYIPVDGKIIDGKAFIDRAAITGESMPVEVQTGDNVTSADIVKSGYIKVLAEKVGVETTLSQIVKMVKEAGNSKAPLQKAVDKKLGKHNATFADLVKYYTKDTNLILYHTEELESDETYKNRLKTKKIKSLDIFGNDVILGCSLV